MAEDQLAFFIDADDEYRPPEMPKGTVRMGGREYEARCPKDSLPLLMARIEEHAEQATDPARQREVLEQIAQAVFSAEDATDIIERVVLPYEPTLTVAFLIDTVRRVYEAFAPYLEAEYADLGVESPVKAPQDHKPPQREGARKAPAKKAPAKKVGGPARRR